jgi:hypothetical protein
MRSTGWSRYRRAQALLRTALAPDPGRGSAAPAPPEPARRPPVLRVVGPA